MTSIYIALLYCLSRNKSRVESTRGGVNMEGGARSARARGGPCCACPPSRRRVRAPRAAARAAGDALDRTGSRCGSRTIGNKYASTIIEEHY